MRDPQAPTTPAYWSDRPTALYDGELTARYGRRPVRFSGSVVLHWQPYPQIVWRGATDDRSMIPIVFDTGQESSETVPTIELPVEMPPTPRRRGAVRPTNHTGQLSDSWPCDGLDFHLAPRKCDQVTFNLINGMDLLPLAPLKRGRLLWSGRWELDDGTWLITIDSRPHLAAKINDLKLTRSYAFTHVGLLRRIDGADFAPSTARALLDDLFLFLTLLRGATVGIALPVGSHQGITTWRHWSSGLCAPFTASFSWADPHAPRDLGDLWPKFRSAMADRRWSNALLRATRHYAEANQAVSAEVTLTLAQAALELLGTAVCVDRDNAVPFSKWDRQRADWRTRRLLRGKISIALPKQFKALSAAAKKHGWRDGPAALKALRDTVTHWTTGKPNVDVMVWAEAAQLGLHYLEMALLSSLGYSGRAFDRTKRPLIPGGSALVPWAL